MKNKKKLLIAVAAMGLLAVGTAGVGTAAWFVASQNVSITADDTPNGTFTVGQTSIELTLTAEIHFVAGNPNDASVQLTTWGKSDALAVSGTAAENTRLLTGAKANAGAAVTYSVPTTGWTYIPVYAWIEATNNGGDAGAWRQAITDAGSGYTGTVKYTYSNAVDTGNLLLATELFGYAANTTTPTAYAKASESSFSTYSTTGVTFTASAKDLITSHESEATKLLIGHLVLRAEGSLRDHDTSKTYAATIAASSSVA